MKRVPFQYLASPVGLLASFIHHEYFRDVLLALDVQAKVAAVRMEEEQQTSSVLAAFRMFDYYLKSPVVPSTAEPSKYVFPSKDSIVFCYNCRLPPFGGRKLLTCSACMKARYCHRFDSITIFSLMRVLMKLSQTAFVREITGNMVIVKNVETLLISSLSFQNIICHSPLP